MHIKVSIAKIGLLTAVPLLAACVDDNYDLSDIDTTTRIEVKDLKVPVNIDPVKMGDVFDIDEDSKIQVVEIDGKSFYALSESGTFESEGIEIDRVTADAPVMTPTRSTISIDADIPGVAGSLTYRLKPMGNDVEYNAAHIDESIVTLESVRTNITFTITMTADALAGKVAGIEFTDVVISMPKGLGDVTCQGSYDPKTGNWSLGRLDAGASHVTSVSLNAKTIDFVAAGVQLDANHNLDYKGQFRILEGLMAVTPAAGVTLPADIEFRADYTLTDMVASAFTGDVNYLLDGLNIDPVSLSDIPDILAGEGTDIRLNNPQIYLTVNNPVADSKLNYTSGLALTANRPDVASQTFSLDNGSFTVNYARGVDGPYNFVLSPEMPVNPLGAYAAGLKHVPFSSLGNLLAAPASAPESGMPESIDIALTDPQVPLQHVTDFKLGVTLPAVSGSYELMAPLSLTADSRVVYTDRVEGWSSEDLDAVTITTLSLDCQAVNNCPVGVIVTARPIDVDGNYIDAKLSTSFVEPNSTAPLTITMEGEVRHLDGVELVARLSGSDSKTALTPEQTLTLTDIRARVSGYYEKEL